MRWFERRGIRVASIVGLVVGVMLLGVGIFGLVSAAQTNSDSQATKDQVTVLREETDALDQQREAAIADAEAAVAKAAALGMKTSDVEVAVLTVHEATHETVAAGQRPRRLRRGG